MKHEEISHKREKTNFAKIKTKSQFRATHIQLSLARGKLGCAKWGELAFCCKFA